MKQNTISIFRACQSFIRRYHRWIIGAPLGIMAAVIVVVVVSALTIKPYQKYVLPASSTRHSEIGIVLGAGITKDGRPFKELQSRLDVAAAALERGSVDKLLLSGDNRFSYYDEPGTMIRYLTEVKHIAADKLQPDYAGRSTYESCERAAKVFGVRQAILFSAQTHLPRAIYLCRHFGIEAYGIASPIEANNGRRRELQAGVKALFNVHVRGEPTILGSPIQL